ncbi:protein STIP1 homolog [Corticium candelabrum]|uniref:protein STIP1 homolog n=1 Tax=Corticium candelabrum TaxID=121492 RepID=UPI002E2572BA|nr:protein STIP1 homolog [Corticium candelabrum]
MFVNPLLYGNRALCYLKMGEYKSALADGKRCIVAKPEWDKGQHRYAQALFELGHYREARKANNTALKYCSSSKILEEQRIVFQETMSGESRRPQPAESVSLSENVLTSEFVAMSEPAIPSESFTPSEFVTRSENVPTSEPVPLSESVTPLELMKPSESVPLVESFPLNESTFITSEIVLPDQSESVTPESASIEQSKVVKATNSDQSPLGWCLCCSLSGCWKCCK